MSDDLSVKSTVPTHRIAREAALHFGLGACKIRLELAGYNCTYRLEDAQGVRYAMRISLLGQSPEEVANQFAWAQDLARETPLDIGALVELEGERPALAVIHGHCVCLTRWVWGRKLTQGLRPKHLHQVGAAMAQMHRHGAEWQAPSGWERPRFDQVWLHFPSPIGKLEPEMAALFTEAHDRIAILLGDLLLDHCHLLHGDLHQGNYRFTPNQGPLGVIDFDDSALGHRTQDIAICLYYLQDYPHYPALKAAFEAGYASELPFDYDPKVIEALLIWRALGLCAAFLSHPSARFQALVDEVMPRWQKRCRAWIDHAE